jgi:alpha-N-arabinofuranosidase
LYRIASGANVDDYAWTEALMRTIGDLGCGCRPQKHFQAISLHYYTYLSERHSIDSATSFTVEEFYQTMANAQRMEELLTRHSSIMDVYDPERRIGLVVDEWGTWWEVEEGTNPGFLYQQNTLRDALVASIHFDIFHRHADRVVMTNIAQTINVLQAMILTEGDQMILTPTYHVFEMNKQHQDAASLPVHLAAPSAKRQVRGKTLDTLSISASAKDGRSLISLTNLEAEAAQHMDIHLRGGGFEVAEARILTSLQLTDRNTPERLNTVSPQPFDQVTHTGQSLRVELPPHSFVTVALNLGTEAK